MLHDFYQKIIYLAGGFALFVFGIEGLGILKTGFTPLDLVIMVAALTFGWRLAIERDLTILERYRLFFQ